MSFSIQMLGCVLVAAWPWQDSAESDPPDDRAAGQAATAAEEPAEPEPDEPDADGLAPYVPEYHDLAAVRALLDSWEAQRPDVSRFFVFDEGVEVPTLEIFGAGDVPPAERPGILLLGGLDGRSVAGGEAVLSVVHDLLADPSRLPPGVSFVAIPWASPSALGMTLRGEARDGRDDEPVDEDHDGRADEDGPDDVDGDGRLFEMLVLAVDGAWALDSMTAFPRPARPSDSVRYERTLEGRDDDGDGRFNEDGPGGIVLDQNFPLGRRGAWGDPLAGRLPMSAPLSRALADLVLRRPVAVVVCFQGEHGGLAIPGGVPSGVGEHDLPLDLDRPVFEQVAAAFQAATGRSAGAWTLREAWLEDRPGAALDWLYAVPGVLALEVAPWGPAVALQGEAADELFADGRSYATVEAAWQRWVDNDRGGIGYSTWRDVELGEGRRGLLGGWDASVRLNPPVERLPDALAGTTALVRALADGLPELELEVDVLEREGDLVHLRARVANVGRWPTGLASTGRWPRAGDPVEVTLELELPADAERLAGAPRRELGRLAGGQVTADVEWIVLAPAGTPFTLRARAPWALPVERRVKP